MSISELLRISINTLKANKLRAFLTLSGIIIGVFSIIAIMTLLNALQAGIEGGLSELGSNTFQIQKFPAIQVGGPGSRAKYRNREDITYEQGLRLIEKATVYKNISLEDYIYDKSLKTEKEATNPNYYVGGVMPSYLECNNRVVQFGRFITDVDLINNNRVCVLGMDAVDRLFPNVDPIGRYITIDNSQFKVIGVFEKKGEGFGSSNDNFALLPITTMQQIYGKNNRSINIAIQAEDKLTYNECMENIISVMRVIRKDKPGAEDSFEIYSNESLIGQVNSFTKYFKYGAGFISFIAMLAAGVGIMNIMLVSVTERTKEIGIRKAIGAKNNSILKQFLFEAIILCEFGGLIGILLGVITGNLIGIFLSSPVVIPYDWVIIGLVVCSVVGIVFGVYPAYQAAKLNPIDALRYE
ncbi:MAG TPA: ABC transporter permease [Ignavibacteria bacterium]|nr:ABC transporter permease [Ignavibacteria bacterium]HMR39619.1 ABC transporter permease [Ignavibacteria bacterium]